MHETNHDDTTKRLIEPDAKTGKFEPDPNDPFVERYIPAPSELQRLNEYFAVEIDQAIEDDKPARAKKLRLLDAYRGKAASGDDISIIRLVRRAVRRNVAYVMNSIFSQVPLVTCKPTSDGKIEVLVEDPTFGTVPLEKSTEECAQAKEWWLEYKLRNKLNFREVVKTAAKEAKRGQTPHYIKVVHEKKFRTVKAPRFEKKGAIGITFNSKDDLDVMAGEPTRFLNISTYSTLMPADEVDVQNSRWFLEWVPETAEDLRRNLYNGEYFLIKKDRWEDFIKDGGTAEPRDDEQKKAADQGRVPTVPKGKQSVAEIFFNWTVPMKETLVEMDEETGEPKEKTLTKMQEYSFVGKYHKGHGELMSMVRLPFDHGQRPYIPVYDEREPFGHEGESVAEDVLPYQNNISQLNSLEIRGGVVATTPVVFAEPGSLAGDWLMEHEPQPGSIIPRQRADEVEIKNLGDRPQSLLGLIQHHHNEYERETGLGDLQLGLNSPSRTPSSSIAQVLGEGQTEGMEFLESFCQSIADAIKLYVQTVQQYMRTGEKIPFDPETKALLLAAFEGQEGYNDVQQSDGFPVRFPKAPITDQYNFQMTAVTRQTEQQDFEKLVALKQIVDADGAQMAQIIGPLASGQLSQYPTIVEALVQQFERSQKLIGDIAKSMRKDGGTFAISSNLLKAVVKEQQMMQQMQMGDPNAQAPQGAGPGPGAGMPPGGMSGGGMGAPVPEQGVPQPPVAMEGGNAPAPGGPPI
jgi:hypothetical protein